jgi:hypothetical protein
MRLNTACEGTAMRVILSLQTEALLPPTVQHAFDAYFRGEKSRADIASELALDHQLLNQILADLFERALAGDNAAARIEVRS